MTSKNAQLKNLVYQFSSCRPGVSLNPLTMSLNGVVDPAVMGGIAKYQEVRSGLVDVFPYYIATLLWT